MRIDAVAVTVSGLCLVHCLALPLLASVLPLFGSFAGDERVHQALVLTALPIAAFAAFNIAHKPTRLVFVLLAGLGAAAMTAGAFVEAFHDYELSLTVIGSALLIGAHLYRWQNHQASQ